MRSFDAYLVFLWDTILWYAKSMGLETEDVGYMQIT